MLSCLLHPLLKDCVDGGPVNTYYFVANPTQILAIPLILSDSWLCLVNFFGQSYLTPDFFGQSHLILNGHLHPP